MKSFSLNDTLDGKPRWTNTYVPVSQSVIASGTLSVPASKHIRAGARVSLSNAPGLTASQGSTTLASTTEFRIKSITAGKAQLATYNNTASIALINKTSASSTGFTDVSLTATSATTGFAIVEDLDVVFADATEASQSANKALGIKSPGWYQAIRNSSGTIDRYTILAATKASKSARATTGDTSGTETLAPNV